MRVSTSFNRAEALLACELLTAISMGKDPGVLASRAEFGRLMRRFYGMRETLRKAEQEAAEAIERAEKWWAAREDVPAPAPASFKSQLITRQRRDHQARQAAAAPSKRTA